MSLPSFEDSVCKTYREQKHGTQHYYAFTWRGEQWWLTGRFGYYKNTVLAEAKTKEGKTSWSCEEGNFYDTTPRMIWTDLGFATESRPTSIGRYPHAL